jgi:hypothetical protein
MNAHLTPSEDVRLDELNSKPYALTKPERIMQRKLLTKWRLYWSAQFAEEAAADARVAAIEWLDDGARLPSGRVIRFRWYVTEDQYVAHDEKTGERVASGSTEAAVWQRVEDAVREGELG